MEITKDELERAKEDLEVEDDLEDFDLVEEEINYEIWLLGNDSEDTAVDFEYMIDDGYTEEAEAKKCYEYFKDPEHLAELVGLEIPAEVAHLYIRLEAVIPEGPDMFMCNELVDEAEIENFRK